MYKDGLTVVGDDGEGEDDEEKFPAITPWLEHYGGWSARGGDVEGEVTLSDQASSIACCECFGVYRDGHQSCAERFDEDQLATLALGRRGGRSVLTGIMSPNQVIQKTLLGLVSAGSRQLKSAATGAQLVHIEPKNRPMR